MQVLWLILSVHENEISSISSQFKKMSKKVESAEEILKITLLFQCAQFLFLKK